MEQEEQIKKIAVAILASENKARRNVYSKHPAGAQWVINMIFGVVLALLVNWVSDIHDEQQRRTPAIERALNAHK